MKGQLEGFGINCWLKDEHTVTIDPILTNAVGGIKLMVEKEDEEKARLILQEIQKDKEALISCPACGGHQVEYISSNRKTLNWLSAIITFMLGSYAIAPEKLYHCFDCGKEFKEPASLG